MRKNLAGFLVLVVTFAVSSVSLADYPYPPQFTSSSECSLWVSQNYVYADIADDYWMWFVDYSKNSSAVASSCTGNDCVVYYPTDNGSQGYTGGCYFVGNAKYWTQIYDTLNVEVKNLNNSLATLPDYLYGVKCTYQKGSTPPSPDGDTCVLQSYKKS